MSRTIGPQGRYPYGQPLKEGDGGEIRVGFYINEEKHLACLNFGTLLTWLSVPPAEAAKQVKIIKNAVIRVFGERPYDKSTLPIRVIANREKGVIELHFPLVATSFCANPEVWLALCERIEEELVVFRN